MPDNVKAFFQFFKTRPLTLGCYGLACFLIGAAFF